MGLLYDKWVKNNVGFSKPKNCTILIKAVRLKICYRLLEGKHLILLGPSAAEKRQ